jgi:hypothetical protein
MMYGKKMGKTGASKGEFKRCPDCPSASKCKAAGMCMAKAKKKK